MSSASKDVRHVNGSRNRQLGKRAYRLLGGGGADSVLAAALMLVLALAALPRSLSGGFVFGAAPVEPGVSAEEAAVLPNIVERAAKATATRVDWKAILKDNPKPASNDMNARLLVAIALANTGKVVEAKREFDVIGSGDWQSFGAGVIRENEEKIRVNPGDVLALNKLAFTYSAFGRHEEALVCFKALAILDPKNPNTRNYLAMSYYMIGDMDSAVHVLQETVRLNMDNQYTHFLLGLAYQKQGKTGSALLEFMKAPGVVKDLLGEL